MNETLTVAVAPDIIDLAERFLANRRNQKQQWREASSDGNIEVLRHLGHELKGTAGAFGFHGLSELAEHLEEAVTRGDLEEARDTVEHMIGFLEKVTIVPC